MKRVIGIIGIFFKTKEPDKMKEKHTAIRLRNQMLI